MSDVLQSPLWRGGPVDDPDLLDRLPKELRSVLANINGCVMFGGGFHIRGAVFKPRWHSLRDAWLGASAFHTRYSSLLPSDVPFGEEATGDQFVLRNGTVYRLSAETDELDSLGVTLDAFLAQVERSPVDTLLLQPFLAFVAQGGRLEPGQLINCYPPFCFKEAAASSVRYAAVPAEEQLAFLADLASQLRSVPKGGRVRITIQR